MFKEIIIPGFCVLFEEELYNVVFRCQNQEGENNRERLLV
jgi:hypothetical protein